MRRLGDKKPVERLRAKEAAATQGTARPEGSGHAYQRQDMPNRAGRERAPDRCPAP